MSLSETDLAQLRAAKTVLENPGLAAKITGVIGMPIEKGLALLPGDAQGKIKSLTSKALDGAFKMSLKTVRGRDPVASRDRFHKLAASVLGAGGGAVGWSGLVVELPLSTMLMMRSIADIARSEGEDLDSVETSLACLSVFAFGGESRADDAAETGYFGVRTALARSVAEAAEHLASKGLAGGSPPALLRFITLVANRFGVAVSEKVAAQLVPVVGAAGGMTINLLFMSHFQDMARGHFTVRRLERKYGEEAVREAYDSLKI